MGDTIWLGLCDGVTVTVVVSPLASTIGLALIRVDLLPSTSNSVVVIVAGRLPPKNLPNFLSELKAPKEIISSVNLKLSRE